MADYGAPLQFGLSITPEAANIATITSLVQLADATGLDLVAIQDHAYNHTFLDTWTLITFLAAKTQQVHFLPDVADLPLRPPAMLAKSVATLDRLTDGRAELAIGAGRHATEIRRLYNVVGSIGSRREGQGLNGPVELWIETLTSWATNLGFDTFVFWPIDPSGQQVRLFTEEVVPRVLEDVNAMRSSTAGTF